MIKEEKFKIIQFIRELIFIVDKELDNFPKKDIDIKNKIRAELYDLLEICYEANTTEDKNLKKTLLVKIIAKIKVLDFLLDFCREKQLIPNKRYVKISLKLDDVIKYASGWLKKIQSSN